MVPCSWCSHYGARHHVITQKVDCLEQSSDASSCPNFLFRLSYQLLDLVLLHGVLHCTSADCCHAGEVQACADAAADRLQALEAEMQTQSAEAEAAAAAAQALLDSTQAESAAALIATRAGLQAAVEAAEAELSATKVAVLVTPYLQGVFVLFKRLAIQGVKVYRASRTRHATIVPGVL